jgi:hypothetical protein
MILNDIDIIGRDIKVYQSNNKYYLGISKRMYLIAFTGDSRKCLIGGAISGRDYIECPESVNVKINNTNVFLTSDNLLILTVNNLVYDLNKKIMYKQYIDRSIIQELANTRNTRKTINLKNT